MNERALASIVASLGKLSLRWRNRRYSFRRKAVKRLVRASGFSANMAEAMMDAVFGELTEAKLWKLLKSELKDPFVLDGFKKGSRARGPAGILHIFAANAPQAPVLSFVLGMLLKSRNVGKLSARDAGFLDIYLQSLRTADRPLWRTNQLIGAKDRAALSACAKKAELVVAYGSEESLEGIRKQVPASTPFFAYGHRVSAALYSKEALNGKNAVLAARDVWMADQRGCLSPVTLYVQKGGRLSPEKFAVRVAGGLHKLQSGEKGSPRRGMAEAAAAQSFRDRHAMQKLKGRRSAFWESSPRGLWTVLYEEDLKPSLAVSSQLIVVKGYKNASQVLSALKPFQQYLQCVALECTANDRKKLAEKLSALGVNRICRAGKMQHPPVTWHHDGKLNLASWIRWTDLEE